MLKWNNLPNQFKAFTKGSPEAFEYFFEHYYARVYYYLLRLVKNRPIASELTEKAFKTLFDNYRQIESINHLHAFLYYFARKCGNRWLEGLPCTDENETLHVPPAEEILGLLEEVDIVLNESQSALQSEIQRLSQQRKKVMEMKFYLQLDVRTIAAQLNLSPQTVRNHLSQSMICIKKRLGRGFDTGSLFL
jgi:RNA polymerase sigma-70 factor (ECF subfamily)